MFPKDIEHIFICANTHEELLQIESIVERHGFNPNASRLYRHEIDYKALVIRIGADEEDEGEDRLLQNHYWHSPSGENRNEEEHQVLIIHLPQEFNKMIQVLDYYSSKFFNKKRIREEI